MLGWDCETTGVNPEKDRIVTSALVRVGPDGKDAQQFVIDPGVEIPEAAARIHGWTTERVRAEGGKPAECLDVIAADLALAMRRGTPVCGMNLSYDITLLDRELRRYQLPTLEDRLDGPIRPVIDVYVLDKQVSRRPGSRKLVDMAAHYGVALDNAHDAAADVLAACRIAYKIGVRHPQIGSMSLDELHDAQIAWRAQQQASLEAYFKSQGKNESCDGRWPLIPLAETAVSL